MIFKNIEIEINLTIHEVSKPYHVKAEADIEFEFDEDWDAWIKSIDVTEAIVVDRFNDAWQFKITPDKDNSLYVDLLKQIEQAIEDKNGEEYIDYFIINEMDDFKGGRHD
jgi:hypothetical protein